MILSSAVPAWIKTGRVSRSIFGEDISLLKLTAEDLLELGFRDLALWTFSENGNGIEYRLDGWSPKVDGLLLDEMNSLYAFVQGSRVEYIGKTARTLRERFQGYRRPGPSQTTNRRNNENIRRALASSQEVRIFVFNPPSKLRFGSFDISIAAGIEDSLIAAFSPPWNRPGRDRLLTEEAEREQQDEPAAPDLLDGSGLVSTAMPAKRAGFQIKLGQAYYRQGIINPGVEASHHLGAENEPICIRFGDGAESVISRINRTANRSGSVRIFYKGLTVALWFQKHFALGDTVNVNIIDRNTIELLLKA